MLAFIALSLLALASAAPEPRVVNGELAKIGEFPWQLAIFRRGRFHCGASIVGPNHAITAAHCLEDEPSNFEIKAGTNHVNADCKKGECVSRILESVVKHPNYIPIGFLGFPNDIGIINWTEPIKESTGKVSIKYVKRTVRTDEIGKKCYISGWGRIGVNGGPLPSDLRKAEMDALTQLECKKIWGNINDGHICLHDKPNLEKGACNGDSGGPFVCEFSKNNFELVGATSWGVGGCNTTYPSVYSRITYFKKWLDDVIPK